MYFSGHAKHPRLFSCTGKSLLDLPISTEGPPIPLRRKRRRNPAAFFRKLFFSICTPFSLHSECKKGKTAFSSPFPYIFSFFSLALPLLLRFSLCFEVTRFHFFSLMFFFSLSLTLFLLVLLPPTIWLIWLSLLFFWKWGEGSSCCCWWSQLLFGSRNAAAAASAVIASLKREREKRRNSLLVAPGAKKRREGGEEKAETTTGAKNAALGEVAWPEEREVPRTEPEEKSYSIWLTWRLQR